jgi:hypothetical protein
LDQNNQQIREVTEEDKLAATKLFFEAGQEVSRRSANSGLEMGSWEEAQLDDDFPEIKEACGEFLKRLRASGLGAA